MVYWIQSELNTELKNKNIEIVSLSVSVGVGEEGRVFNEDHSEG